MLAGGVSVSGEAWMMNLDWFTLVIIDRSLTLQRLVDKKLVLPVFMSSVVSKVFPIISGRRVACS